MNPKQYINDQQRIGNLKKSIDDINKSRLGKFNKMILTQSLNDEIQRITNKEAK